MKLFWARGYEGTSIADLTDALGIGVKSLYAAFGSKDALYEEALGYYTRSYEHLTLGRFREAATVREAMLCYLVDTAAAITGADSDLPRGCMVNLGTVGGDGHDELRELMRTARTSAYDVLTERLERAVAEGELPASVNVGKLARYLQTIQSGMAIRARDGADRAELQAVAELAIAGWEGMIELASEKD
ncbi:TetR/AcrR family transcriptional regulator; helix-turn-helix transcriptional regulator [Qipengyuania sp. GH1]|nr:TetR/AcrR family transcriptional regulator; helix-turn-helix transcriptional regulator [Qipengyuania aestuarii]